MRYNHINFPVSELKEELLEELEQWRSDALLIPKGTTVCRNKWGHNNFGYPREAEPVKLGKDIHAKKLSWVGGSTDWIPYQIKDDAPCLKQEVDELTNEPKVIVIGNVMWVKKE